jgi:Domain of unknown function (DUF6134)
MLTSSRSFTKHKAVSQLTVGRRSRADDNGTIYEVELARQSSDYAGSVNGQAVTLPIEAFPNSIWHYGIVDHALLFDEVNLKLLHVTTHIGPTRSSSTIRKCRPSASPSAAASLPQPGSTRTKTSSWRSSGSRAAR